MTNLVVVFLTGLTTGGLSCLAVQGGLLASSVARQAEQNIQKQLEIRKSARNATPKRKNARQSDRAPQASPPSFAWPILLFLGAKLVAYTILGFFLGWLGSMLQLTPFTRAMLQLAIGLFMVGTALRMFNVHPLFRYFAFEPPASLTRYIRRTAKDGASTVITPIFLGALTVFIPCGVTQAIMALAIGAGDPLQGAAIMFAFTLGASPVFFAVAYLVTQIGEKLEARFLQFVAVTVLVLGFISIDGSLALLGSPFTFSRITRAMTVAPSSQVQPPETNPTVGIHQVQLPSETNPVITTIPPGPQTLLDPAAAPPLATASLTFNPNAGPPSPPKEDQPTGVEPGVNVVTINVFEYGYEPSVAQAPAGQVVQLNLVSNDVYG